MVILIGHSSISENGTINGAKGDSTGKEVCTRSWYDGKFDFMAFHPDAAIREKHAKAVEAACANNNIGYGQGDRNSLYPLAMATNYDLSKVGKCNCDCSSLQHVAAIASGAPGVTYGSNAWRTATMRAKLKAAGYVIITDSTILKSADYCVRGAMYVRESVHTVCGLTNGAKASQTLSVAGLSNENLVASVKTGDVVSIASGATYYNSTKKVPDWVLKKQWVVKSVSGDRVVVNVSTDGKSSINSPIAAKNLTVVRASVIVSQNTLKVGATVSIASGATYYNSTKKVPDWVLKKKWLVKSIKNDRVVIDKSTDGKSSICSPIAAKYLTVVK